MRSSYLVDDQHLADSVSQNRLRLAFRLSERTANKVCRILQNHYSDVVSQTMGCGKAMAISTFAV